MSKSSKIKKEKVRKISEEEYVQYVTSLKETGQVCVEQKTQANETRENTVKA